ncbi:MAG: fused MFS/spermidine synthase [Candidatus Xenobiia bacterium LiM19]
MVSSSKSQQSILFFLPALLFFVSGCSSLIFEMIWTRRLALVMGSTIYAASATVASFMLGLGVGAYLADRLVRKSDNLFRLFGILELTAGLGGLLVTLLIPLYGKVICGLFSAFGSIPAFMVIARVVLIFLTLLIPCMAMGASLPVLSHLYTHRFGASFSRGLAFLYAINTLGAATGAFLTDFFIVEHLGITGTAILAALINLGVALIAFIFSPAARASIQENIPPGGQVSPLLTLVFLACGFCGMVLQISWTRMLVFFNGCDVFAFSTTLVTYLVGIVVGSLVMARFAAGFSDNRSALGYIFGLTGVCRLFKYLFCIPHHPIEDNACGGE